MSTPPPTIADYPPQQVIGAMRRIKRDQCTAPRGWQQDIDRAILQAMLMECIEWPAFLIRYTARGIDYLHEHTQETGE